jgi:hypothetical protein
VVFVGVVAASAIDAKIKASAPATAPAKRTMSALRERPRRGRGLAGNGPGACSRREEIFCQASAFLAISDFSSAVYGQTVTERRYTQALRVHPSFTLLLYRYADRLSIGRLWIRFSERMPHS